MRDRDHRKQHHSLHWRKWLLILSCLGVFALVAIACQSQVGKSRLSEESQPDSLPSRTTFDRTKLIGYDNRRLNAQDFNDDFI